MMRNDKTIKSNLLSEQSSLSIKKLWQNTSLIESFAEYMSTWCKQLFCESFYSPVFSMQYRNKEQNY